MGSTVGSQRDGHLTPYSNIHLLPLNYEREMGEIFGINSRIADSGKLLGTRVPFNSQQQTTMAPFAAQLGPLSDDDNMDNPLGVHTKGRGDGRRAKQEELSMQKCGMLIKTATELQRFPVRRCGLASWPPN